MNSSFLRLSFLGAALLLGPTAAAQSGSPSTARPGAKPASGTPAGGPSRGTVSASGTAGAVTWYRDVLPIVRERCQGCHEPEGVGAFPLLTHAQATEHLVEIGDAVRAGYMPPWQPADGCQSFRDARRLTKREADTLLAWVAAGGPAGTATEAPPPAPKSASLTPADLTLHASPVGSGAEERTRCYAFSFPSEKDRDLVAYELQPGGPGVQHVLLYTAPELDVEALDATDPEQGWECSPEPGGINAQLIGMWAPGNEITRLPPGTGVRVPAGAPLIMQVHTAALPAGKAPGPTVARLQFSPQPVTRRGTFLPVWKSGYSIPSKATGFTLNRTFSLAEDGVLLGVFPHMHGLGRRIKLEAGNTCVIDIPYWDTSSQQPYFFESLVGVSLRAGSKLTLTCTWNNPSSNRVRSGEGAGKEMCMAWLFLTQ
ncbi:hypothetical protein P2318_09915 [Myxococcaceae bacterium GXIMD 01537]